MRCLILRLILAGCLWSSATISQADTDDFRHEVLPYLKQHCLRCHGEKKEEGQLRLDQLSADFSAGGTAGRWADVIERISSGEMPPQEEPQPKPDDSAAVVESLNRLLKESEAARMARRERVSHHRLTREELVFTVEDLLGVHYDATDPNGLPEDPEWNGFERLGSVLTLSPSHIEKSLAAAETILAEAFPAVRPKPITFRRRAYEMLNGPQEWKRLEEQGLADKVRYEMWPGAQMIRVAPPGALAAGTYRIRVQVSGLKPEGGRAPHISFYATQLDRTLFEQDVIAPEDRPVVLEFTTHLPAGGHPIRVTNDVVGPSTLPRSGRYGHKHFLSIQDGRLPWQLKLTDEEGRALYPFLILDWIEWEGPVGADEPTFAERSYLPTGYVPIDPNAKPVAKKNAAAPTQPITATAPDGTREVLAKFMERAYRRTVAEAEVERSLKLLDDELAAGEKFLDAYKTTLVAILCSKDFLYLVEGSASRNEERLSDWELASRLSYMLWSTMPDESLFAAARDGSLHRPEVLKAQLDRMLADPKSRRFSESFARQWLQLRKLGMFPPDKKLFPDYDPHLEQSMRDEATAFFREVLERGLSLREFLHSDWTMLNARLAEHYGIANVEGSEFRRVALAPESHRGGVLTQAAVLSLTSDGQRHRPVHRGKWVSEAILGKPVPPPLANVDPIDPTPATQPKATIRQKLDAHKSNAHCAACHRKFDPLGLAFDHYDAIGRWRTTELVRDGSGDDPPVDASGTLIDGRRFADSAELKQLMLADLDKFNAALVEKLAMFALRRTMTFDDREALARIAQNSRDADYNLRSLVEALVMSDLFQLR